MKLFELKETGRLAKLAKRLNVSVAELNKLTQPGLDAILKNIGKHDFVPDAKFDAAELKRGIKVEQEHTSSLLIAKLIAKDHLSEDPKYYTKLYTIDKD